MTPTEYRELRLSIGSQEQAARRIPGLAPNTIARRERGELPIDGEAALSMRWAAAAASEERRARGVPDDATMRAGVRSRKVDVVCVRCMKPRRLTLLDDDEFTEQERRSYVCSDCD